MAFTPVNDGDLAVAPQVQQIIDALSGVTGAGQPIALTTLDDDALHALTLKNLGTGGLALHAHSSSGGDLLDVRDAYTDVDNGTLRVDHTNNRVGVNKTSPTVALDVTGAIAASGAISGATLAISGAATFGSLGATAFTGRVGVPVGTGAAPGLYFDVGLDEAGVNSTDGSNLQLATGGAARLTVTDGATTVANALTLSSASLGYLEMAAISAPAAPTSGMRVYTRSGGLYRIGAGDVEREIDRSSSQSLTNKTLTSPVISTIVNTGTLTLPTSTDTLVGRDTTDTLTNKTLTSPVISTISNSGTITLPTGTRTLVARDTTDTLTNKTLTAPVISTISNTGTITLPTATTTLVGRDTTDTLTNKTLTSPTLNSPSISTLTTAGDLLYGTGSGVLAARALGTKGHALLADASSPKYEPIYRRNRVINGCMRVCQRTTLGSSDDTYTLDRWTLLFEAVSNGCVVTQETSDVPTDGSKYALKMTVGSDDDDKFGIATYLEYRDISDLRGKTISLQAKLKATAAITDVRMAVLEWTGTADSVTSDVVSTWGSAGTNPTLASNWAYLGTPANLSVTTSWATYKVENLTVGASANNLAVFIWCEDETTTATTDSLLVTDVQLEEGTICTQFERRPMALELQTCQRYFEALFGRLYAGTGFGMWLDANTARIGISFRVPKRTAPSVSLSSPSHFELADAAASSTIVSLDSVAFGGESYIALDLTCGGSIGVADDAAFCFTNSTSARIFMNAEM